MSGNNEAKNGSSNLGGMAIGCVIDIAMMIAFCIVVSKDTMVNACAYAILLAIPVTIVRVILYKLDMHTMLVGQLLGPVVLIGAMLLAVFCPIETEKDADDPAALVQSRSLLFADIHDHGIHEIASSLTNFKYSASCG